MHRRLTCAAMTLALVGATAAATAQTADEIVAEGRVMMTGSVSGLGGHEASGTVRVVEHGDYRYLVLGEDFAFDGSPDPHVGFGAEGKYHGPTTVGPLAALEGEQLYRVPNWVSLEEVDQFHLWCFMFSAPLASADLADAPS